MADMKSGLRSYILLDEDITDVIGQKCYSFPAPENAVKPYITLTRINAINMGTINESLDIYDEIWQIDVFSSTDSQAEEIKELLITRLNFADRTEMGSYTVYTCTLDSIVDGSEIEMEGSENADIRKIITFLLRRDRTET